MVFSTISTFFVHAWYCNIFAKSRVIFFWTVILAYPANFNFNAQNCHFCSWHFCSILMHRTVIFVHDTSKYLARNSKFEQNSAFLFIIYAQNCQHPCSFFCVQGCQYFLFIFKCTEMSFLFKLIFLEGKTLYDYMNAMQFISIFSSNKWKYEGTDKFIHR